MEPFITLPALNWFSKRDEEGKLVNVSYSGSFGTSPTSGIFSSGDLTLPIFEYKVEALAVNDLEAESIFRAESSVRVYRKTGVEYLSPVKEIRLIGLNEQNLSVIKLWLDKQFNTYKKEYYRG